MCLVGMTLSANTADEVTLEALHRFHQKVRGIFHDIFPTLIRYNLLVFSDLPVLANCRVSQTFKPILNAYISEPIADHSE